jgi:cytidyltransferase-like protein
MAKVFVSGSFDLLHSGHVAFLKEAAEWGELYVGVGRDQSIEKLKGRKTICPQEERLYMVRAIRYVHIAWLNTGMGMNDFFKDMIQAGIKTLIVNRDQDTEDKRKFCEENDFEYIVLERKPEPGLPARSATSLRKYYDN